MNRQNHLQTKPLKKAMASSQAENQRDTTGFVTNFSIWLEINDKTIKGKTIKKAIACHLDLTSKRNDGFVSQWFCHYFLHSSTQHCSLFVQIRVRNS